MKTEDINKMKLEHQQGMLFQELLKGNKLPVCDKCQHYVTSPEKCNVCTVRANIIVE